MKKLTIRSLVVATALVVVANAVAIAEETQVKNNEPQPGVQVVQEAVLPLALGGEWTGGDAMPLGGANPVDETKTEVVKYLLFLPTDESAKTEDGFPLFSLYHPAAIIYRRELRQVYERDVLILRDSLTIETQK